MGTENNWCVKRPDLIKRTDLTIVGIGHAALEQSIIVKGLAVAFRRKDTPVVVAYGTAGITEIDLVLMDWVEVKVVARAIRIPIVGKRVTIQEAIMATILTRPLGHIPLGRYIRHAGLCVMDVDSPTPAMEAAASAWPTANVRACRIVRGPAGPLRRGVESRPRPRLRSHR